MDLDILVSQLATSLKEKRSFQSRHHNGKGYGLLVDEARVENKIRDLADDLDNNTLRGSKQYYKDRLIISFGINEKPSYKISSSFRKITENYIFLSDVGVTDIKGIVERFPQIFNSSVEKNMKPRVDYLRSLGVKDVGRMIEKSPSIFGLSVEENMKPKVDYLISIGVKDVGKMIERLPSLFSLSVEENIKPKVDYLRSLGVKDIGKMIERSPALFCYHVENNMKLKVDYLRSLGVKDVGRMIERSPALFCLNIEKNMKPRADYLRSLGVKDVGRMIEKAPPIFGLNIEENMKPKVDYLIKEMEYSMKQIEKFPNLLSYSLNGRIIPRREYLKQKGKSCRTSSFLSYSDKRFAERIAKTPLEEYLRFKENYIKEHQKK